MLSAACAVVLLLVASPLLNLAVGALFNASILSLQKMMVGILITIGLGVISFGAGILALAKTDVSAILKAGDKI